MSYLCRPRQAPARTHVHRRAALATAMLVAATAACDEGQGPEENGSMDAYVEDSSGGAATQTTGGYLGHTGTLTGMASVAIYSDANGWISLGSSAAMNFSLQSTEEEQVAANAIVPLGTYTRVRVELSSAQALITAGSDVGGGVLSDDVAVAVGGSDREVLVDKIITPFTVTAGSRAVIRTDLNSEVWVTDGAVTAESAADTAIESAVTIAVN